MAKFKPGDIVQRADGKLFNFNGVHQLTATVFGYGFFGCRVFFKEDTSEWLYEDRLVLHEGSKPCSDCCNQVTAYKSKDGRVYATLSECQAADLELKRSKKRKILRDNLFRDTDTYGHHFQYDSYDVAFKIVDNWHLIKRLMED